MAMIEVNIAGFQFTHGRAAQDPADAPRRGWHIAGVSVRPVAWRAGLLRRPRAA